MGGGSAQATPGPADLVHFDAHVDPLALLGGLIERYGQTVRYQTRFGASILFTRPEHVQAILHSENYRRATLVKMMLGDGLLASDGPRWRSQRRLMQRDFLPASVARFGAVVADETERLAAQWRQCAARAEPVDLTAAMTRLTLRIIVAALFSEDLSAQHSDRLCAAVTAVVVGLGEISWAIFGTPVRFSPGTQARLTAAKKVIDDTCQDMIARRRAMAAKQRPADLLTLLVEAETDAGAMTDQQLRDEIVTMLVGGHETTALALSWAWKALAENPAVESALAAEAQRVLRGQAGRSDDLARLPWARAVLEESMRLYPPVWYMARVASEEDVIDGHRVPRGACVMVSAWFTHRHPEFWNDAERFDPTRFTGEAGKGRHRYAYFPFGGGRHQCLGMHLAMLEGTLILAQLSQEFRLLPTAGQVIRPSPGITLRQTPSLRANVERRATQLAEAV